MMVEDRLIYLLNTGDKSKRLLCQKPSKQYPKDFLDFYGEQQIREFYAYDLQLY